MGSPNSGVTGETAQADAQVPAAGAPLSSDTILRWTSAVLLPVALALTIGAGAVLVQQGRVIPLGLQGPVLAASVEDTPSTPPPLPDLRPRDLVGLSVGEVTDDLAH